MSIRSKLAKKLGLGSFIRNGIKVSGPMDLEIHLIGNKYCKKIKQ